MSPATQVIRNNEVAKTEYSKKSAIDALYDELSKGIESLKKGDVYTIDEVWEAITFLSNRCSRLNLLPVSSHCYRLQY